MFKRSLFLVLGCAVVFFSGCYTARTYVINKERVDQQIPGQPKDAPVKTRKMVVLEVVEKDRIGKKGTAVKGTAVSVAAPVMEAVPAEEPDFTLPQSSVDVISASVVLPLPEDYVVQKDDTLQKISKKVYGAYSKWTRIYEANRDVIKDPNFLKEGAVLKIPALEEQTPTAQ